MELLTLCEFCFTVIGRADIEVSKSKVTMNGCATTQASYVWIFCWVSLGLECGLMTHLTKRKGDVIHMTPWFEKIMYSIYSNFTATYTPPF